MANADPEPHERQIYEDELPPPDDPEVEARVQTWLRARRAEQRPWVALPVALVSLVIGIVIWGQLNAWAHFQMPWLLMAFTSVVLGMLMGFPFRKAGNLFDRRWAVVAFVLGLTMACAGDLYGNVLLAVPHGGVLATIASLEGEDLAAWLGGRVPLDWFVAGLGAIGAAFGSRPWVTEANARLDARLDVYEEWCDEDEEEDDDESDAV